MLWLFLACSGQPNTGQPDLDSGANPSCEADCSQPGCEEEPACEEINASEVCDDGLDNDGDGFLDCLDPDCSWQPMCFEDCGDGLDNNADGLVDCFDPDCSGLFEPCIEVCGDGLDNDEDGLVDCEDADCSMACSEFDCSDGVDNNANGLVDCDDSECWGLSGCEVQVGVRILSGSATLEHSGFTSSYSSSTRRVSAESHRLTLHRPAGSAYIALPFSNIYCDWTADRLHLNAGQQRVQLSSSAGYHLSSNQLLLRGFESSGGCASWLSSEILSFDSQVRHPEALVHSVSLGKSGYLDGARWAAGSISFNYLGSSGTSYSFEVDSALTEAWVFSP